VSHRKRPHLPGGFSWSFVIPASLDPAFVAYELDAILALDGIDGFDAHRRKALRAAHHERTWWQVKLIGLWHREISCAT
jgi:hypothetical protein